MKKTILALAASLAVAAPAAAAPVFSDNFDGDALALNQTTFLGGWTVANGTVDLIGPGFFPLCDDGRCVDLDGSTSNAGEFTKALNLTGGVTYTAAFDLAGNHRGGSDILDVAFGTTLATYNSVWTDPFANFTLNFTPTTTGFYNLTFAARGGDNIGPLLDNVSVVGGVVPEPATWAMMLIGFGAIGSMVRSRRSAILAA